MKKSTVLVEARPFCLTDSAPMDALKKAGVEIIDLRGLGIEDSNFVNVLKRADVVICGNDLNIDDALLEIAPKVKAIAKLGAGLRSRPRFVSGSTYPEAP